MKSYVKFGFELGVALGIAGFVGKFIETVSWGVVGGLLNCPLQALTKRIRHSTKDLNDAAIEYDTVKEEMNDD